MSSCLFYCHFTCELNVKPFKWVIAFWWLKSDKVFLCFFISALYIWKTQISHSRPGYIVTLIPVYIYSKVLWPSPNSQTIIDMGLQSLGYTSNKSKLLSRKYVKCRCINHGATLKRVAVTVFCQQACLLSCKSYLFSCKQRQKST